MTAGRERVIGMGVAIGLMVAMIAPHLDYVPLWDGRVYANCVVDAAFNTISTESLRCANHPSQGWAFILAIAQRLDPGSVELMHATNLVLGAIALIAIRSVFGRAFPDAQHARALDLLTVACAAHPVVLSTLLQPNIDFGVYVFFFVALAGLFTPGAIGACVAILGGTLMVFSKETGVPAYGFAVVAAFGAAWARTDLPLWTFAFRDRARLAVLSIPVLAFLAHVIYWNRTHPIPAIWKHGWQQSAADAFKFFDLSEPNFLSYAAGLFVVGFMWVVWLPVALDGAVGLARIARRQPSRAVTGADLPALNALVVALAGLTYVLTSFRTWSNLRYFALLYPLFLLVGYAALVRLGVSSARRLQAVVIVVVLFVVAAHRSVDPLSRLVYGTFDAGEKRMYAMTSITGEFEGPGRDQLVYNLEFAGFHHVQNALFRQIEPTDQFVFGAARHLRWNIWTQLDSSTHTRTMRRRSIKTPIYADEIDISVRRSPEAWFLEFSNRSPDDRSRQLLAPLYRAADSVVVTSHGHRLTAYHLVRREAAGLP